MSQRAIAVQDVLSRATNLCVIRKQIDVFRLSERSEKGTGLHNLTRLFGRFEYLRL